ncbi:MAG: hypothetical protein ACKO0Z_02225 [Betaproteobacteria bacterium]
MTDTNIKKLEAALQEVQRKIDEQRNRVANVTQIAVNLATQTKVAYSAWEVDYDEIIKGACEIYDEICGCVERDIVPATQANIDRLVDDGEHIAETLRRARQVESMMGDGKVPKIALPNYH